MEIRERDALAAYLGSIADIPEDEFDRLAKLLRRVSIPKGGHFLRAGERPESLAFLASGIMRLYYLGENGDEFTKSFCTAVDLVAAYSALLRSEASRLSIEAIEDSTLLVLPYCTYRILADGRACWETLDRRIAEELFVKKERREAELLLDDAAARYANFLSAYPGLEDRILQRHVASYLGISPVSLSRIRAKKRRINTG